MSPAYHHPAEIVTGRVPVGKVGLRKRDELKGTGKSEE